MRVSYWNSAMWEKLMYNQPITMSFDVVSNAENPSTKVNL